MIVVDAASVDRPFGRYRVEPGGLSSDWEETSEASEGFYLPGFVDVHFHGAYGVDFMSASRQELAGLADRMEDDGYEVFLPTTVTASVQDVLAALAELPDHRAIGGFHLEGPFISQQYPGAQPVEAILDPPGFPSPWDAVFDHPRLRLVTLAPEQPGGLELVKGLVSRGVVASLGHTAGTYAEALQAVEAGVTHATHTFNAMRGLHHREAGTLGLVLSDDRVRAELIYDGYHVSQPAAEVLIRSKGLDKVLAVSDCTAAKGLAPGSVVEMWGHSVEVGVDDVRLLGTDTLAGSASTLLDCFRKLAEDFGVGVGTQLACLTPRMVLGLNGEPERFNLFSPALELKDSWRDTVKKSLRS